MTIFLSPSEMTPQELREQQRRSRDGASGVDAMSILPLSKLMELQTLALRSEGDYEPTDEFIALIGTAIELYAREATFEVALNTILDIAVRAHVADPLWEIQLTAQRALGQETRDDVEAVR